jgi:hypothetical protein
MATSRRHTALVQIALAIALAGCAQSQEATNPAAFSRAPSAPALADTAAPATAPPTAAPTTQLDPPPDLTADPLVWFAPLPPLPTGPGRAYTGSDDFMSLFTPDADWGPAGDRIDVFKLYGEWVAYQATLPELEAVVETLRRRDIALAVEAGPLDSSSTCGQGIEGFAGREEGLRIATRIRAAGGRLDLIGMDEPWYYGHVYDGARACHWSPERIAQGVVDYVAAIRTVHPNVLVGDTEAVTRDLDPDRLVTWLDAYRAVAGTPLPFVHLDLDFGRPGWPEMVASLRAAGEQRGTAVGLIVFGDPSDTTDEAWFGTAAARILAAGGADDPPEHLLFQSWQDRPDRVLPAAGADTWTWFVGRYATDPASLGELLPPPNLATGATARASAALPGEGPARAVDGDPGTGWNAGTGPPAWIEIDLGSSQTIGLVRLRVQQYPAGLTDHRLLGLGPGTSGAWVELARLRGVTDAPQSLEWRPEVPRESIRYMRVETVTSPSWVAWSEIEVYPPTD